MMTSVNPKHSSMEEGNIDYRKGGEEKGQILLPKE